MDDAKPYLDWNLQVVMKKKKIRRPIDLMRLLKDYGYKISSTQLSRIIANRPKQLKTEFLDALVHVLDCDIAELLVIEKPEESASSTVIPMRRKRPAAF